MGPVDAAQRLAQAWQLVRQPRLGISDTPLEAVNSEEL